MIALASVLAGLATVLVMSDGAGRTVQLLRGGPVRQCAPRPRPSSGLALALFAGAVMWLLVGGRFGAACGVSGSSCAWLVVQAAPRRQRLLVDRRVLHDLPLTCDALAACVAAGASPHAAIRAVADAGSGPLSDVLRGVAMAHDLGASAAAAWEQHLDGPAPLRTMAVVMARSSISGASPAALLDALAADQRERQRLAGESAARRAGVAMVAPLGLCFLPAFVLLGVVPLVAGLLGGGPDLLAQ